MSYIIDPSRPFFQRASGQMGVYIDIMEAAENAAGVEVTHGSEHFYVMLLMEALAQEFTAMNKTDVKGGFELHQVLQGGVIEGFRPGIVMVVQMRDLESLENLWRDFESGKLTVAAQHSLIGPALLTSQRASHIKIRARLWKDEYEGCRNEFMEDNISLSKEQLCHDKEIWGQIKDLQQTLSMDILALKDGLEAFESTLGEFIHVIKRCVDVYKIYNATKNLITFRKFVNIVTKKKPKEVSTLIQYLSTYDKIKEVWVKYVQQMWFLSQQIHGRRDCSKHKSVSKELVGHCQTLVTLFKEDNPLGKVSYPQWEAKTISSERELVFGPISLIPKTVHTIIAADLLLDEYYSLQNI